VYVCMCVYGGGGDGGGGGGGGGSDDDDDDDDDDDSISQNIITPIMPTKSKIIQSLYLVIS